MRYEIGLSRNGAGDVDALLEGFAKAGVSALEISPMDIVKRDLDEKKYPIDYKRLHKAAKENKIHLWSMHLPFWAFDVLEISKKELCKQTVAYLCDLIGKASEIGIDKFVVHPSGEPIEECKRAERIKCAQDSLFTLAEYAKKQGAIIAVEDLPRTCLGRNSDEILQLISAHEDLRVCFDTNHLLGEDPVEFIKKIGRKLVSLHVSDYDFINERHWLPGEGKMDWQAILKALDEVGYNGVWLYEIGAKCPNSILRDRDLTNEDFVKNANELFDGKTPTVFSKPKPNLGFWE